MSKVFDAAQQTELERLTTQSGEATEPVDYSSVAADMLATWETWNNAESTDAHTKTQAVNLLKAACFAAVAYDGMIDSPMTADAAPAHLLRIFLTALADPASTELDQYRAINRQEPDVAAVREAEAVIERNGEEVTAAAMISVIADFLRENGKAVLLADNSFGKQILEFKLASDNMRTSPLQSEQWHRANSDNSVLFYTLRQDGWNKGQPSMVNDIQVHVSLNNGSKHDLNSVADTLFASLPAAPTPEEGQ